MKLQTLNNSCLDENPYIETDDAIFEHCIQLAESRLVSEAEGYLGSDSIAWEIFREPCVLMGGFRAVMLQMLHPAVAQGVEQSSSFRHDLIGRAKRTINTMNSLVFGSRDTALNAAQAMHTIHHRVYGRVPEESKSNWAGDFFRANDIRLKNWVGLTTLDSVVVFFEALVRPLSQEEKDKFAYEAQTIAMLCGLPEEYHKDKIEAFATVRDEIFASGDLAISNVAVDIVNDLFDFVPTSFDERLTLGFLPIEAKQMYGIEWTEHKNDDFETLLKKMTFINKSLPPALRYIPAYRRAKARVLRANKSPIGASSTAKSKGNNKDQESNFYFKKFGFGSRSQTPR